MTMEEQNENGNVGQPAGFSVCLVRADGNPDIVCCGASRHDAAREFWRCSNNASALSGVVRRVSIVDDRGCTNLAWEFGRGYTFDGKTFHSRPVLEKEVRAHGGP
jgi:hypothetical protein